MADFDIMSHPSFGEAGGLAARDDSIYSSLRSRELLGKIAMEPLEQDHRRAQTRDLNAQAMTREQAASVATQMAAIARTPPPDAGEERQEDPRAKAQRIATAMLDVQPITAIKMLEDLVQMDSHIASAGAAAASEGLRTARAAETRSKRFGALASAALAHPQAWDVLRMQMAEEGYNVEALPATYAEARPLLQPLARAALSAAEQSRAEQARITEEGRAQARKTAAGRAQAAIQLSTARTKNLQQQYDIRKKNGGNDSPETAALRSALAEESRTRTRLRQENNPAIAPMMPKNPAERKIDTIYRGFDGKAWRWDGKGMLPVTPAKLGVASRAGNAAESALGWLLGNSAAATDNDPEDDDDD